MALNIDAKFERKLTCAFSDDMKNFANFCSQTEKQRLKNSDFILKSEKAELNINKNLKQTNRPDAV